MVSTRALLLMFAASVACKVFGDFGDSSHCVNSGGCAANHVCTCKAENHGCVPLAQIAAIDEGCLIGQGSSTGVVTSTEPTGGTSGGPSSTTAETGVDETTSTGSAGSTSSDGETTHEASLTGSSGTSTGELLCDPDVAVLDADCDASTPYCVAANVCGTCSELDEVQTTCAEVESGKSLCDAASGRCVECTAEDTSACPADKPGCDEATGMCGPCTEHSQCPDTACDMKLGTCFPGDSIMWVENTIGECDNNGNGSELQPLCTLLAAANKLVPGKPTTIKIRPGQSSAMQPLPLLSEGDVLAVVRDGVQTPTLDGAANSDPMIQVSPGSRVYLSNLRLFNTNGPAIVECTGGAMGAELYLDDVQVNGNGVLPAKAIDASNCAVRLRRARIYKNRGGAQLSGGTLWVENSHFAENGSVSSAFGAFNFLGSATATITYSSIALHPATLSASTFNCINAGTITIRNSAIAGAAPLNKSCMLDQTSSRVEEGANASDWFNGPNEGVLRAKEAGNPPPLKDVAMWTTGDPRRDFDREPRPTVGPSWAGADEPPS